jgi:hypothetical protein
MRLHRLTANDGIAGDYFGNSVGIHGNIAIVGASYDSNVANHSGSAYLFDVATGQQLAKLTADDAAAEDMFGSSVSIRGDIAIVGAQGDDGHTGSAYLFDLITYEQLSKLTAYDGATGDQFGVSVSICGDIALVGADGVLGNPLGPGAAYLFDVSDPANPVAIQPKFRASDGNLGDGFGSRVSVSGDIAAIGARYADNSTGSAYLFDVTTGEQLQKLTAGDGQANDEFGFVAIDGSVLVVGAPYEDAHGNLAGAVYVFTRDPCPADFNGDGVVNASDLLILLGWWGTAGPDGDVDGDGDVETSDLLALLAAWGECPRPPCPWDFNGDGAVDDLDADILVEHWGDCPDPPEECPWDLTGDGVVDMDDMDELLEHYGPCP